MNELQPGEAVKYGALIGLEVLDDPDMFRAGKIDVGTAACDGDLAMINVAFGRSEAEFDQAFRTAVDTWLRDDIVATLKSSSNREGLDSATLQPRQPASARGVLYIVLDDAGAKTITFIAV